MTIIKTEFALALNQVATERGISPDEVIAAIVDAVIAAYKREYPDSQEVELTAKVSKETGETKILKEGVDITPPGFGRIAAQTAKQVILQKIREAEKKTVAAHYMNQVGTIIKGRVIRYDGYNAYLDIGRTEAVLPREEQMRDEQYQVNDSLIVYLKEISQDKFGNPRIIVSRADPKLIEELFKREVPEITNGTVTIKKVVREPGERAKIAVFSETSGVDPVGACVGQKGVRVQTVTDELGGKEKIDIIQWNPDEKLFLIAALSPAKITEVEIDKEVRKAKITVDEKEAPLAIGRGGINVNLASRLTDFEIDIVQTKSEVPAEAEKPEAAAAEQKTVEPAQPKAPKEEPTEEVKEPTPPAETEQKPTTLTEKADKKAS